MVRRNKRPQGNSDMKRSVVAALGAALIAMLGASSAAEAATIDFGVVWDRRNDQATVGRSWNSRPRSISMTRYCSFPGSVRATIPGWSPSTRSRLSLPRRRARHHLWIRDGDVALAARGCQVVDGWPGRRVHRNTDHGGLDQSAETRSDLSHLSGTVSAPRQRIRQCPEFCHLDRQSATEAGNTITVSFTNAAAPSPPPFLNPQPG